MADLSVAIISGRFGKQPEIKQTNSGKSVISFTLAVNGYKEGDVDWIDCAAWEKTAELIAQYCNKGDKITIKGRLKKQTWEDQNGTSHSKTVVVADHLEFMGGRKEGGKKNPPDNVSDSEIPF